jgi:selenocysteine lyase/cysteine desulfurase
MMHTAQEILLNAFSAHPEKFVALPIGSGSTGAIEKTIKLLKYKGTEDITIFVTPYEHHSNSLPWI